MIVLVRDRRRIFRPKEKVPQENGQASPRQGIKLTLRHIAVSSATGPLEWKDLEDQATTAHTAEAEVVREAIAGEALEVADSGEAVADADGFGVFPKAEVAPVRSPQT